MAAELKITAHWNYILNNKQGMLESITNTIFAKNLSMLSINHSDNLLPKNNAGSLQILESKNLLSTAMYNGKLLHSKYNPIKEDNTLLEHNENTNFDCIVVFEMGLGYLVESLYEKFADIPIIIIELNLDLSIQLLSCVDYSKQEAIIKSTIFVNPSNQVIIDFLYAHNLYEPLLLRTQAAKNVYSANAMEEKIRVIQEYSTKSIINKNTLNKFRHKWVTNTLKNLTAANPIYSVEALADKYKNLPVLFCAAGASIEEIIPYFAALRERMPIICVDTALGLLHTLGIVPDIIVSVDPQYINSTHLHWHLQWAIAQGSILLIDVTTSNSTLHLIPNSTTVFTYKTSFVLAKKLCVDTALQTEILSGGSVATIAWEVCRILGAKEIYTTGLDLSFASNRSHCKGTIYENKNFYTSTRLKTIDSHLLNTIIYTQHKKIESTYTNKPIISNLQFSVYKSWFEEKIARHKEIACYSLSENIVKIENMKFSPIESLLMLPVIRDSLLTHKEKATVECTPIDKQVLLRNLIIIMKDLINTQEIIEATSREIYNNSIEQNIHKIHQIFANSKSIEIIQFLYKDEIPYQIDRINLPSQTQAQVRWLAKLYRNIYLYMESIIQQIEQSCNSLYSIVEKDNAQENLEEYL